MAYLTAIVHNKSNFHLACCTISQACTLLLNQLNYYVQVANFDNIYHFVLANGERAPLDGPYTAKSSALLSEKSVKMKFDILTTQ